MFLSVLNVATIKVSLYHDVIVTYARPSLLDLNNMHSCALLSPFNFRDEVVRAIWCANIPFVFVLGCIISRLCGPIGIHERLRPFLTLKEVENYYNRDGRSGVKCVTSSVARNHSYSWAHSSLSYLAFIEMCAWISLSVSHLPGNETEDSCGYDTINAINSFVIAFSWLYSIVKPRLEPMETVPYDLFVLYLLHICSGLFMMIGYIFYESSSSIYPLSRQVMILAIAHFMILSVLFDLVLTKPLAIPHGAIEMKTAGIKSGPEDYTTLWGWITFNWVTPLLKRGREVTPLKEEDIWDLSLTMRVGSILRKIENSSCKHLPKSILRKLWEMNSSDIVLDFIGTFFSILFHYCQPFLLKRIADNLDRKVGGDVKVKGGSQNRAFVYAFFMFLAYMLRSQAQLQHLWRGRRVATRVRSYLMAVIYNKTLKKHCLSSMGQTDKKSTGGGKDAVSEDRANVEYGRIYNMMSRDSLALSNISSNFYFLYGVPFELLFASILLYRLLGAAAFVGLGISFALAWPINNTIAAYSERVQKKYISSRDVRMSMLSELLNGIRTIKFFAWEEHWINRIIEARNTELYWLFRKNLANFSIYVLWISVPVAVSAISFGYHIGISGRELDVGTIFTATQLFAMVREPLHIIPRLILHLIEANITLRRIQTFVEEEEIEVLPFHDSETFLDKSLEFGFYEAYLTWPSNRETEGGSTSSTDPMNVESKSKAPEREDNSDVAHPLVLKNISINFPEDVITVITGPTASGKSALLLALLGEMALSSGQILYRRDPQVHDEHDLTYVTSYAAQTPWLQHQSIRDNILFGSLFEKDRYEAVIDGCALGPDLALLENGDRTEIGTKGISLSGGQKTRVALARAVYARTKYVLLDDPLSAVDSQTARILVEKLFMGPLLKHRTVLLVTHHLSRALPCAHYLVRMDNGRICLQDHIQNLKDSGLLDHIASRHDVIGGISDIKERQEAGGKLNESYNSDFQKEQGNQGKLADDEIDDILTPRWTYCMAYIRASSLKIWLVLCLFVLLFQVCKFIERYWIKAWTELENGSTTRVTSFWRGTFEEKINNPFPPTVNQSLFCICVYVILSGCTVFIISVVGILENYGALTASKKLFDRLLFSVTHATFRWIDTTPAGRILNRFSQDIGTIDSSLSASLQTIIMCLATFFASMITLTFIFPLFILPAICLGSLYYKLANIYIRTSRSLRRMEAESLSPIFSGFGELLEGVVTVRSFSAADRFKKNMYRKIDRSSNLWYQYWMTNRWLQFRFDCLSGLVILITNILAIYASRSDSAGWAAICITTTSTFTNYIYWTCRFWTQLELNLSSVERVVQYHNCPQEDQANNRESSPPMQWPMRSGPNKSYLIEARNLEVRYAPDLPSVLHGVSFAFRAQERIGIIGRTGSGKTTLAMTLLRIVNPTNGSLFINGIDIKKISLHDLRSKMTIIPQDTVLFSGTIRQNLDPLGEYSDADCINALSRVHLIPPSHFNDGQPQAASPSPDSIRNISTDRSLETAEVHLKSTDDVKSGANNGKELHLHSSVNPGGSNFSVGQRQLISMARALLRKSAIVIFDEATSSLDFETDRLIQQVIREEFVDTLLLTIAHRLHSIIDYDRVLVLDEGRIAEFDSPYNLWNRSDSLFRDFCSRSGDVAITVDEGRRRVKLMI